MDNIKIKKRIYDGLLLLCIVGIVFLAENIFMHQRKYKKAEKEYEKFRVIQDQKYISSMDEFYSKYLNENSYNE